jgi:DNA-binding transcriptional ArsR family regulator
VPAHAPKGDPFEALGNPQRRAIVRMLARGGRSVQEIADELPISRPAVSRHLKVLTHAGLVSDEAHGARHLYRLEDQGIAAVRSYLEDVWGEAATSRRHAQPQVHPMRMAYHAPAANEGKKEGASHGIPRSVAADQGDAR